jgi:hypothetical protein
VTFVYPIGLQYAAPCCSDDGPLKIASRSRTYLRSHEGSSPPAIQARLGRRYNGSLHFFVDQSSQIPGLPEVTSSITPDTHPGLLGICLSGAGPTILALALDGFDAIAEDARRVFREKGIEVDWMVLDIVTEGSSVEDT